MMWRFGCARRLRKWRDEKPFRAEFLWTAGDAPVGRFGWVPGPAPPHRRRRAGSPSRMVGTRPRPVCHGVPSPPFRRNAALDRQTPARHGCV